MSFASDMAKFKLQLDTNSVLLTKKVMIDLAAAIIRSTPVDTGRARGNWQYSTGEAIIQVDTLDESGQGALAKIIAEVNTLTAKDMSKDVIAYIGNNLDYIEALEYGSSKQASPGAMVRINVDKFQAFINKHALELRI